MSNQGGGFTGQVTTSSGQPTQQATHVPVLDRYGDTIGWRNSQTGAYTPKYGPGAGQQQAAPQQTAAQQAQRARQVRFGLGGGTRPIGQNQSGTANPYGYNYQVLAQTNPQYADMLDSMGLAPQYQLAGGTPVLGSYGVDESRTGMGSLAGSRRGIPQRGAAQRLLDAANAATGSRSGGQGGQAPYFSPARAQGAGSPVSSFGSAMNQSLGRLQGQVGGFFGGGGGGGGGAAGGLSGSLSSAGSPGGVSVANPLDPFSAAQAAAADRQTAIDELRGFRQGLGRSGLSRGIESLGSQMLQNPEAIDEATFQQMQTALTERNAAQQGDLERQLREDLGASGRLGTGTGVRELSELRRRGAADLNTAQRDLLIERALRRRQDQLGALQGAAGGLGVLGNLGGAATGKIADVFMATDRGDQDLQRIMQSLGIGLGGGYGVGF